MKKADPDVHRRVHLAVALMKSGLSVASIDLDSRQRSFTHYIDNRLAWGRQRGKDLPTPAHLCFDEDDDFQRHTTPALPGRG